MARTVGVKEAHQQLTKLIRAAERGDQIVITREGAPVAVLLGTLVGGAHDWVALRVGPPATSGKCLLRSADNSRLRWTN